MSESERISPGLELDVRLIEVEGLGHLVKSKCNCELRAWTSELTMAYRFSRRDQGRYARGEVRERARTEVGVVKFPRLIWGDLRPHCFDEHLSSLVHPAALRSSIASGRTEIHFRI
jgi:hypothetical protein